MAQASFTQVPRPSPPAVVRWSLPRVLIIASVFTLVASVLLEFGFDPEAFRLTLPALPGVLLALAMLLAAPAWLYLAAGLLMSVLPILVLFVFGAVAQLDDPTTGRSFASGEFLVATLVLALPAGIRGFLDARRKREVPFREILRRKHGALVTVVVALLVGSALSGIVAGVRVREMASSGGGYDFPVETSIAVLASEYTFPPQPIAVPVGEIVEIKVTNEDAAFHTFTYELDGRTYNHDLPGGSTVGFLVRFDETGTFPYWCAPHSSNKPVAEEGEDEMRGTIEVS